MTIDALAEKYRLKVTRDECHHKIIQGRRGQLYADAGKVCAMWLDARVNAPLLAPLGGKQWIGDYTLNERHWRLRDAKITGIAADKIPLAIRLTGCKYRHIPSEAQLASLAKAQAAGTATRFKPKAAGA